MAYIFYESHIGIAGTVHALSIPVLQSSPAAISIVRLLYKGKVLAFFNACYQFTTYVLQSPFIRKGNHKMLQASLSIFTACSPTLLTQNVCPGIPTPVILFSLLFIEVLKVLRMCKSEV